jgi:hypothetical protein
MPTKLSLNQINWNLINAETLGAVGDGAADDTVALQQTLNEDICVLSGTYRVTSELNIQNNSTIISLGAKIIAATNDFTVLNASGKYGFKIQGMLDIQGPDTDTPEFGTGTGMHITNCSQYHISEGVEISGLKNGIILDGTDLVTGGVAGFRGRQGRLDSITIHDCGIGAQVLERAEYTVWTNPQITQCKETGFIEEAGNTNVVGGNIQDNENGVLLKAVGTTNACHGMFTSVNINHNVGYNLRTEDVIEGHTFNGCHFYGDSALAGTIELIRSNGITITSGIIDARIVIDGGVTPDVNYSGWNKITDNQINTTYTVFDSSNNGREKTIVRGNYLRTGDAWGLNDRALYSTVTSTVGGSPQAITSDVTTTLVFSNELEDNRGLYDNSTGVYTADQAQFVNVGFSTEFVITGGTFVEGFVAVYVAGAPRAIFPVSTTNAANTSLTAHGNLQVAITAGQTIDVRANIEASAGTIAFSAADQCNLTITSSN